MVVIGLAIATMLLVISLLVFEGFGKSSSSTLNDEPVEVGGTNSVVVVPLEPLSPEATDVNDPVVVETTAPRVPEQVAPVLPIVAEPESQPVESPEVEVERPVVEDSPPPRSEPQGVVTGIVSISSLPPVDIYIDGVLMGQTPFADQPLSVGTHRIVLQGSGEDHLEFRIEVTEDEEVRKIYNFGQRTWILR